MKTLRLTDDLTYRIARVRLATERDTTTVDARKLELADAVLTAVNAPAARRLAKLATVARPHPLSVDIVAPTVKQRRA